MPTRRELRKALRQDRKLTKQRFWNLSHGFVQVAVQALRDKVWNRTPDDTAICVEAMLFTIASVFASWPDDWKHKHYFWPDGKCSCQLCIHGIDRRTRWCNECHQAAILRLARPIVIPVRQRLVDFPMSILEVGPPQS